MEAKTRRLISKIYIRFIILGVIFLVFDVVLNLFVIDKWIIILVSLVEIIIMFALFYYWTNNKKNRITSLEYLLKSNEDEYLEFKSSLRWDYRENKINKEIEMATIKNLAGFLNKDGGTILIGISDEKTVLGLQADFDTLAKKNADGFVLHLTNLIDTFIGREFSEYISIKILNILKKNVCKIDIEGSNKPVYVKHDGIEEFYVRTSNQTKSMPTRTAHNYINLHWKKLR